MLEVFVALEPVTCCNCGIVFGMTPEYISARKKDHQFWTCPNGHSQHWAQQTEAERLRDQLAREKHLREQAQARADHNHAEAERINRRLNAARGYGWDANPWVWALTFSVADCAAAGRGAA